MPKRKDIKSILIIGAGPIVIGQACEFDYSGAQACKALREEGYRVILVNSNPATIMTDPEMADATYIEPINWQIVEKIIAKEKPDALLPTMGGQTALNCALDLDKFGVLKNHVAFGGSFIYFDSDYNLSEEIKKCNEEIKQCALNGKLKPEEIALKYGQLLRLSVERFIKNDLLLWDKERDFEHNIIKNLSKSKSKIQKLDDQDLEALTNIYKYCNYSNLLHADKENPSALSELTIHIDKFEAIYNKVKTTV